MRRSKLVWLLILIVILYLIFSYQRLITDSISYATYRPSPEIEQIADRVDFTEKGKFYFYTSRPVLEPTQQFNEYCSRQEESSAILGCYNGRIYIFDVSNEQLDGVEEVTAAHEMLHAAYDRHSPSLKAELARLLEQDYERIDSESLNTRMDYYARTEPGQRTNELYAILGTEVEQLSPELEEHYGKYFNDRTAIVRLHNNYQAVFNGLELKSKTAAKQIDDLAVRINSQTAQFNQQTAQLDADIRTFNSRAQSGYFNSQAAFNAERSRLVERSNSLESFRASIELDIARYNQLIAELNATNKQASDLHQSLDSSLAPAPSL